MEEPQETPSGAGEFGELGTGRPEDDDGNEPIDQPEPRVLGGGDQGAHPGSLVGVPAPNPTAPFQGATQMSEDLKVQAGEDGDEGERFYSQLDWDDIAEAFIGSLLAAVVILLLLRVMPTRRRKGR